MSMRLKHQTALVLVLLLLAFPASVLAQFVAFNDYAPGTGTHSNATTFGPGASGLLKNITNGTPTAVTVTAVGSSLVFGSTQGVPDFGTPASTVFDDYVDFGGSAHTSLSVGTL